MSKPAVVLSPEERLDMMRTWLTVHRDAASKENSVEAAHAAAGVAEHAKGLIEWASQGGYLPPGHVVTNGKYSRIRDGETVRVYRSGELLGKFWEDSKSEGYAVFLHGNSKPVARPKSERGCVLKLTDGEWDGRP